MRSLKCSLEIDQEVLLSVFKSRANRPKWVIKHEGNHHTHYTKTRDTSQRLGEKTEGYELMTPVIQ
jgi:hypothetical protein